MAGLLDVISNIVKKNFTTYRRAILTLEINRIFECTTMTKFALSWSVLELLYSYEGFTKVYAELKSEFDNIENFSI